MEKEIERIRRYKHNLMVVYSDLDNFNHVNYASEPLKGDGLLCFVGMIFGENLRPTDSNAPTGGDVVALLLLETDYGSAREVLKKCRMKLDSVMAENRWLVTSSSG